MNAFARLLLCTALSGLALGAQARTFEVSDFAELDNAVIEAEDGDEIVIKKGVYELEAPLEIFSRVTVRGEQGASSTRAVGARASSSASRRSGSRTSPCATTGATFMRARRA